MGVENPDVEIGFLKSTTPDTIRGDVEAGSCLGVGPWILSVLHWSQAEVQTRYTRHGTLR